MNTRLATYSLSYPSPSQTWLGSCLEILLPTQCLVCSRPLRGWSICCRCRPALPDLHNIQAHRCRCCFEPIAQHSQHSSLCDTCVLFPQSADSIRFLWEYEGLARDYIRTMKYRPSQKLLKLASSLLSSATPLLFPERRWDMIVPIPSSGKHFQKRLLHPCVELAQEVAKSHSLHVANILEHDKSRKPQATLPHAERLRRIGKLFSVRNPDRVRGMRVLVVEDVITTGATIAAATSQLKRSGALTVDVLALARTRVWKRFRQRLHALIPLAG